MKIVPYVYLKWVGPDEVNSVDLYNYDSVEIVDYSKSIYENEFFIEAKHTDGQIDKIRIPSCVKNKQNPEITEHWFTSNGNGLTLTWHP